MQFLASELKHSRAVASGFAKLPHYFTAFQTFVMKQAESEKSRFPMTTAFLLLEREAAYRANTPTKPGLFVYQFECIAATVSATSTASMHSPPTRSIRRLARLLRLAAEAGRRN